VTDGVSIREFAKLAGCDPKVVTRKLQSGHLPRLPSGKLDPRHADMDWRAGVIPLPAEVSTPVHTVDTVDSETPEEAASRIIIAEGRAPHSKAEAERIKENYLALLRQLEYDRAAGSVAEIDDVVEAVVGEYATVRNKLLGIGSRVAHRISVMKSPEEVKALIDREVAQVLEELSLDGHGRRSTHELQRDIQDKFSQAA